MVARAQVSPISMEIVAAAHCGGHSAARVE
jgi:hypothetical protein